MLYIGTSSTSLDEFGRGKVHFKIYSALVKKSQMFMDEGIAYLKMNPLFFLFHK